MKKLFVTSLLIISIFAGLQSNYGSAGNSEATYAKAATIVMRKLSAPKSCTVTKVGNNVKLSFGKVAGATQYKIYRASTKNGKYTCIGTTKSNVFKDKLKSNKNYYYKVKAVNKKKVSPSSKVVKATPTKAPTKTPTVAPTKAPTVAPTKTTQANTNVTNPSSNQSFANEVLKLVNQERAKAGLKALTTTTSLQNAANKRAVEIVKSFSHTRPDGRGFATVLADYSISYRAAGENIAYGQRTPSEVMTGWMNSPGHRANILGSQFGKVGIGVYKAADGRYYWTQAFTN